MRPKLIFLYMLIASVAISAVVGIGVLLIGDFGSLEIRVLMTTLTVTVTSILGLACGAYFESGRWRALPLAGIVLAIAAAVMTFFIIWDVADDSEIFLKSTATVTLLALSCSHLSHYHWHGSTKGLRGRGSRHSFSCGCCRRSYYS